MKNLNFLIKIYKEGKLELINPSTEISDAYVKKSASYLLSAKLLLENERVEESISMAYYNMYYLLLALLIKTGIKSENHTASIILLKEIYSIDNKKISFAKKERVDKQYYIDFKINKSDAEELIKVAEKFNAELLDCIRKLTSDKITFFRDKFKEITQEN